MAEHEFGAIRDAQAPQHSKIAAGDWDDVVGTLIDQRPLRPVERGSAR